MKNVRGPNYADLAETRFQELCDSQNLTRNKATQDRTGWDYLIEFDRPREAALAHDRQAGSATARVQIKSTIGKRRATSLKLSNALRFTREPDVCFVVLFQFFPSGKQRILARHFHRHLMEATLLRARKAERDGEDALHRIRLEVVFKEEDEHSTDLIDWMRGICDQQPEDYAGEKRTLAENLGYEGARVRGSLKVLRKDLQTLIDHSVGLEPQAPIHHVIMHDTRFEIPARTPIFEGKPVFAQFSADASPAHLSFEGSNGHTARLDGQIRSMVLGGLPLTMGKAVFTAPGITAVLSGDGHFEINYAISADQDYALEELRALCDFFCTVPSPTKVTLGQEGKPPIETTAPAIEVGDAGSFVWLGALLSALLKVCTPSDSPRCSVAQIEECRDTLETFANCVSDGEFIFRFNLDRSLPATSEFRNLLGYAAVDLNGSLFWAITRRPCLRYDLDDQRHTLVFGNPVILEGGVTNQSAPAMEAYISERLSALNAQIGSGTLIINGGDQRRFDAGPFDVVLP